MRRFVLIVVIALFSTLMIDAQDNIEVIPVDSVAYSMVASADGRFIATAELGAIHGDEVLPEYLSIHLFDAESGDALLTFEGASDYVSSMTFSPDGSTFVTYYSTGWLYLWDTRTGERIREIPALPDGGPIFYTPDGEHLIQSLYYLRPILLQWDVENGSITSVELDRFDSKEQALEITTVARVNYALDAVILDDNQTAFVSTTQNGIIQWDLNTGEQIYLRIDEDNLPYLDIRHIAISPDESKLIYTHSQDATVNIIDLVTGEDTSIYEGESVYAMGVASETDLIAWVGGERDNPVLYVSSFSDPSSITEISLLNDAGEPYSTIGPPLEVAVSSDGTDIFIGGFFTEEGDNVLLKVTL